MTIIGIIKGARPSKDGRGQISIVEYAHPETGIPAYVQAWNTNLRPVVGALVTVNETASKDGAVMHVVSQIF